MPSTSLKNAQRPLHWEPTICLNPATGEYQWTDTWGLRDSTGRQVYWEHEHGYSGLILKKAAPPMSRPLPGWAAEWNRENGDDYRAEYQRLLEERRRRLETRASRSPWEKPGPNTEGT